MVKEFLKSNKIKIVAAIGSIAFIAISIYVGDVTLSQVKDCLLSFDLQSELCKLITNQVNP